jgi:serine/threonine protein kinase
MATGSGVGLYEAAAGRESSSGSDFANDHDAAAIVSARGGLPSGPRSSVPLVKHGTAFDPDALPHDPAESHHLGEDRSGGLVEEIEPALEAAVAGTEGAEAMAIVPHGVTSPATAALVLASPTMLMPAGAAIGSADAQAQTNMSRRLRRAMAPPAAEEAQAEADADADGGADGKAAGGPVRRRQSKKSGTTSSASSLGSSAASHGGQSSKLPTLRIRTETGDDVLKVGNDTVLLVTELARGGELFDRLVEAGNFAEHVVRHVMWQLLSALAHLHARGLVHRDVKPENILVLDPAPSAEDDEEDHDVVRGAAKAGEDQEDEDDDGIDADDPTASRIRKDSSRPKQQRKTPGDRQGAEDLPWLLHSRGMSSDSQSSDGLDSDPTAPPPSLSPLRTGPQGELLPTIKLADFGIARHVGRGPLAMAKTFCGSPQYVAPEVIRARDAAAAATRRRHRQEGLEGGEQPGGGSDSSPTSPESLPGYGCEVDVWSAGVVMFALLAGELPFDESDYGAVAGSPEESWVQRILHGSFRFDPPIWTHVSSFARDLITRMLQVNPLKRPSAVECLRHPWFLPMHAAYAARLNGADDAEAAAAAATAAMAAAMPTARSLAQSAVIGPAAAASIPPSALIGHTHPFGRAPMPSFGLPAVSAGRIGMAGVEQDVLRAALSWASSWLGDAVAVAEIARPGTSRQVPPQAASATSAAAGAALGLPAPHAASSSPASLPRSSAQSGQTRPVSLRRQQARSGQPLISGKHATAARSFDTPPLIAASSGRHQTPATDRALKTRSAATAQPAAAAASMPMSSHEQDEIPSEAERSASHAASAQSSGEGKQAGVIGIQDLDVIAPLGRLAAAAAESRTRVRAWRRSSLQAFGAFASVLHAVAGAADGVVHRCLSSASRCAALTASISTAMFDAQLALQDGDSTSTELLLAESRRWVETVVAEASMAADAADALRSRVSEAAEQTTSASVSASLMDQHHRRREVLDSAMLIPGTPDSRSDVEIGLLPQWANVSDNGSVSAPHSEASADRSAASVSDLEELTSSMKKWIMASPRDSEAEDDGKPSAELHALGPAPASPPVAPRGQAGVSPIPAGKISVPSMSKQVFTPLASSPAPQGSGQYAGSADSSTRDHESPQIAPLLARAMNLDALESLSTLPPNPHLERTQSVDDRHAPTEIDAPGSGRSHQLRPSRPQVAPVRRVSIDGHESATAGSRAAQSSRRSQSIAGPGSDSVAHTAAAGVRPGGQLASSTRIQQHLTPIGSGHHGLGPHDLSITACSERHGNDENDDAGDNGRVPRHIGPPSPTPGTPKQRKEQGSLYGDAAASLSGSALAPGASDSSTVAITAGLSVLHAALSRLGDALRTVADKWRAAARLCEGALPAVDRLSLLARASSTKLVRRAVDQLAKASLFWRSAQAILEAGQRFQAELEHGSAGIDELSSSDSEGRHADLASIRMPKSAPKRTTRPLVSASVVGENPNGTQTGASGAEVAAPASQDLSERLGLD